MKPGKPTTFGKIGNALVFALPGNPVSAFVTSNLFLIPAARILSGQLESFGF
jgi:molybdopterin biosynthesis enzyme